VLGSAAKTQQQVLWIPEKSSDCCLFLLFVCALRLAVTSFFFLLFVRRDHANTQIHGS